MPEAKAGSFLMNSGLPGCGAGLYLQPRVTFQLLSHLELPVCYALSCLQSYPQAQTMAMPGTSRAGEAEWCLGDCQLLKGTNGSHL
jgi:hypothetical protein